MSRKIKFAIVAIAFVVIATACDATNLTGQPQYIVVTATPVPVPTVVEQASITKGAWTITYYQGATDQMKNWGGSLKDPVTDWSKFPNENFPKYNFSSKDGVEYGMAESAYCQQDQRCDINVAAMHYRLISGDYIIPQIDECKATDTQGCAIVLVNVGGVTTMYRNSSVDYGFTVTGRYWNGDAMPITIWALSSNTAFNMMEANKVNRGANCSVPQGCKSIRFAFTIISGNELLMKGVAVINA